jgi:hypothetical protein
MAIAIRWSANGTRAAEIIIRRSPEPAGGQPATEWIRGYFSVEVQYV